MEHVKGMRNDDAKRKITNQNISVDKRLVEEQDAWKILRMMSEYWRSESVKGSILKMNFIIVYFCRNYL